VRKFGICIHKQLEDKRTPWDVRVGRGPRTSRPVVLEHQTAGSHQAVSAKESPSSLLKIGFFSSSPRDSDSAGLKCDPGIFIFGKYSR
jgi:hypothetical protein